MCTQLDPNLFYCYLDGCDLIAIRKIAEVLDWPVWLQYAFETW